LSESAASEGHFRSINIETYRENFNPDDHILVDVREPEEWVRGHIPNAVHIPMNSIPERHDEIPLDKPVVVVCAHGQRSMMVSQYLLSIGFPEVYNLEEGTHGWMMRRLPLDR
jgi:rhodanese-related sulfurtransferase